MIIEIEYFKGDTFLCGKRVTFGKLREQIKDVEQIYDRQEDNFIELLCRMYGWTVISEDEDPEYTYDRDVGKLTRHGMMN